MKIKDMRQLTSIVDGEVSAINEEERQIDGYQLELVIPFRVDIRSKYGFGPFFYTGSVIMSPENDRLIVLDYGFSKPCMMKRIADQLEMKYDGVEEVVLVTGVQYRKSK